MSINKTESGEAADPEYVLQLFVTGVSPVSVRAINNLQSILTKHLEGQYKLEIIDIFQQPEIVRAMDVTAVPVLIKKLPLPQRRLVGDMSETERVIRGLGLK